MKTRVLLGVALLAVFVMAPLVKAQEKPGIIDPAVRERLKDRIEERRELSPEERERLRAENQKRLEEMRAQAERPAPADAVGRHPFINAYLNELPEYRQLVQAHNEKMKLIQQQLGDIRRETMMKLRNATEPTERQALIEEMKQKTAPLLELIIEEALKHNMEIAELVKARKADIVQKALERIYAPSTAPRPMAPKISEPAPMYPPRDPKPMPGGEF